MNFFVETVPRTTRLILDDLRKLPEIQKFYLSGGTALSLFLGHRESEDLDFFTKTLFKPELLQQKILQFGSLKDVEIAEGTLNLFLNKVKLQFLYYPYNLLEGPVSWNGIYLSSLIDIACTKLITISTRGSKKDFVDLYVILKQFTLEELFEKLEEKYDKIEYNYPHILKSLVYFDDAENQPMPRMHNTVSWNEIKNEIIKKVKEFKF